MARNDAGSGRVEVRGGRAAGSWLGMDPFSYSLLERLIMRDLHHVVTPNGHEACTRCPVARRAYVCR